MNLRTRTPLFFSIPLCAAMGLSGCGDSGGEAGGDETAGSETAGDTVADEVGDGDGDEGGDEATTTGDGDGDGDAGDGDGEPDCPIGSEGCPCTAGGGCDPGLMCEAGVCGSETGDGDGDGDGTGDGDGDGDGDPGNLCGDEEIFIPIEAEDADELDGWSPTMSNLGEEMVLAWDNDDTNASATWNIEVPCDDTWHVWVRAVNQGNNDSFFATVDGAPDPAAVFEIACDGGPNQPTYEWRELNWREQDTPACEYLEDPWVQDWTAGVHPFTLRYRESYAISKLWVTNTDQTPP